MTGLPRETLALESAHEIADSIRIAAAEMVRDVTTAMTAVEIAAVVAGIAVRSGSGGQVESFTMATCFPVPSMVYRYG